MFLSLTIYFLFDVVYLQRMSVRNFLRRQVDASAAAPSRSCDKTEVETRPLSEYDNLVNFDRSNFPLSEIKFRFDDLAMANLANNNSSSSTAASSSAHNNNDSSTATPSSSSSAVHHKYQNVLDTLQQRRSNDVNESANNSEQRSSNVDDQQVNLSSMSQDDHDSSPLRGAHRPAISDAKSLFFGLGHHHHHTTATSTPLKSSAGDELDKLIEDIGNAKLLAGESTSGPQYVNFPTTEEEAKAASQTSDKTPSGSSSTTATPSATPTRQDKLGGSSNSRKNSESSSSRSKSPKFMLPESATPSQVSRRHMLE